MVASLSVEFQGLNTRLNSLNVAVADLQARVVSGSISWIEIYDLSTNVVNAHASIASVKALSGIAAWIEIDTGAVAATIAPLYTTLQTELFVLRDFIIANKMPAVDLNASGVKVALALTAGQKTALGAALVPVKSALAAIPGVK